MKKTIVVSFALLITAIFNYSSAMNKGEPMPTGESGGITTLIINGHVTVVLVGADKASLEVVGSNSLIKHVKLKKTGDTLVINSPKDRDFKEKGIVYVPASQLVKIRIPESELIAGVALSATAAEVLHRTHGSAQTGNVVELHP